MPGAEAEWLLSWHHQYDSAQLQQTTHLHVVEYYLIRQGTC